MKMLIKRNLILFFRDKTNVFFSMLAALITILLFILFLADLMVEAIGNDTPYARVEDIRLIVTGLVLSGTVAVATVSSCLNATARIVIDKEDVAKDFFVSPISRRSLMFGYVISSGIIGFIMSGLTLVVTVIYLVLSGSTPPSLTDLVMLLLTLTLGVLSGNSMMFLIACFVKSRNAYSSLGTIVGTLIGFLTGVYIPIGQLPNSIAWIVRLFPTSHVASMFRQLLAGSALDDLGAPTTVVTQLNEFFGVTFNFGSYTTTFLFSATLLLGTSVIFYIIGLNLMKKQSFQ